MKKEEFIKLYGEEAYQRRLEKQKQYQKENKEKKSEYDRQYRQQNKEKIAEQRKQYYQENKEKIIEQKKQYYQDNKEYYAQYYKQYYQDNKEYYTEHNKQYKQNHKVEIAQYYQENKEKFAERHKQYSKTPMGRAANLANRYSQTDKKYNRGNCTINAKWIVDNIFTSKCYYCGESDWRKLGCDRIDNTLPHTPDNVVCCCMDCNNERQKMNFIDFCKRKGVA